MTMVDRDVIRDLIPLYRSGLASPATRKLIESCVASDPALSEFLQVADQSYDDTQGAREFHAFVRARRLLRWQRRLFGLAIGFTVLSFTTAMKIDGHGISNVRLLAIEAPLAFAPVIAAAIGCWIGYVLVRRRSNAI